MKSKGTKKPTLKCKPEITESLLDQIHSKITNRPGNQTAGKLVFSFCLLRADNEIDY